jgi:hypothetical protein
MQAGDFFLNLLMAVAPQALKSVASFQSFGAQHCPEKAPVYARRCQTLGAPVNVVNAAAQGKASEKHIKTGLPPPPFLGW